MDEHPEYGKDYELWWLAANYGHTELIKLFLSDPRVNELANSEFDIEDACGRGFTKVAKINFSYRIKISG